MKIAEVTYEGRGRRHTRRGPSDEVYNWVVPTSDAGEQIPVVVENIEDADYFDKKEVFSVRWTAMGKIVGQFRGPVSDSEAALENIAYREKQKIASALGVKASGTEDELDERLKPEIERLQSEMEKL